MSPAASYFERSTQPPNRRLFARQQVRSLAYVELDKGNGGIILNVGEGGMAIQAVMSLSGNELPELRVQLAAAEEARIGEGRERTEIARTIGELQAQVARDQQEMGFYRGLVAQPGQPAADAVRVQQFRIVTLPGDQHFSLRFSLSRTQRPEEAVNGTIAITIDGTSNGSSSSVDLAALSGGKSELPFNFRYFAAIEQPVTLPGDFKPDHITIEVRPGRKGVAPYRQTFVWNADPIS